MLDGGLSILATAWIFILAPNCIDDNLQQQLEADMLATPTQFDNYIGDVQYVCMGGVDLYTIEDVTVPLLRQVFPDNPLVFVWPDLQEYRSYWEYLDGAPTQTKNGHTTFYIGSAVVGENLNTVRTIKHELTHISNCTDHVHSDDPVEKWYKVQEPPFCN